MQTTTAPIASEGTRTIDAAPSANGGLHEITRSLAELRVTVKRIIEDEHLSQATVAKECDITPSAMSAWLRDKYQGDNDAVGRNVAGWLQGRGERQSTVAIMPTEPEYFEGPTARTIHSAMHYAHTAGKMAMVVGAPGVGKTTTAKAYRLGRPNVWIATMTPARSALVPALQRCCAALGLKVPGGAGAHSIEDLLVGKLTDTRGLLIIDEAQHLDVKAIDGIRSLHDAVAIGVVLLGNERLSDLVRGARRAESTAQLSSRVGYRRVIDRVTKADVFSQLDAWDIRGTAERDYLISLAAQPGALRNVSVVIQLASVLAGATNVSVTRAHLERAWKQLGSATTSIVAATPLA